MVWNEGVLFYLHCLKSWKSTSYEACSKRYQIILQNAAKRDATDGVLSFNLRVIVKTCSDKFHTIWQPKCPMLAAKIWESQFKTLAYVSWRIINSLLFYYFLWRIVQSPLPIYKALPVIAVRTSSKYEAIFFAHRTIIFLFYSRTIQLVKFIDSSFNNSISVSVQGFHLWNRPSILV